MFLSEKYQAQYGRPQFLPLHALVQDHMCRPWNLILMKEFTMRFREQAHMQDVDGNLPLHLILESCTIEWGRAIAKGYARDTEKCHEAVTRCLQFLLGANPKSASGANGNGRLPLYSAIENRNLPFDIVIEPLLNLAPRALLTRDVMTRFYPFVAAVMGPM